MALQQFNATAIFDDALAVLKALEDTDSDPLPSGRFRLVSDQVPVRSFRRLKEHVRVSKLPAAFLIEPETEQNAGERSRFGFEAPASSSFFVDYPLGIIGIDSLSPSQNPAKDVFRPLQEAILTAIMADRTRGGNAHDTIPTGWQHTSNLYGDRLMFTMGFACPFRFTI